MPRDSSGSASGAARSVKSTEGNVLRFFSTATFFFFFVKNFIYSLNWISKVLCALQRCCSILWVVGLFADLWCWSLMKLVRR